MTSKNLKIMSQDLEDERLPPENKLEYIPEDKRPLPENKLEYTPWKFQDNNLLDDLLDNEIGRDEVFESLNFL